MLIFYYLNKDIYCEIVEEIGRKILVVKQVNFVINKLFDISIIVWVVYIVLYDFLYLFYENGVFIELCSI